MINVKKIVAGPIAAAYLEVAPGTVLVSVSDYDRDIQSLLDDYNEACADAMQVAGKLQAVEAERDALREQVGAMRGALERAREVVAFHHVTAGDRFREIELAAIDAALQVEP